MGDTLDVLPSSFDPALHLHSEDAIAEPLLLPSNSNSDDLEAIHLQQEELAEAKTRAGIVIQHRSWKLEDVLRSDDIYNPETPSRREGAVPLLTSDTAPYDTVEQARSKMPFSSSPVLFPPSSSPPIVTKKRKLFQSLDSQVLKKPRTLGGFLDDVEETVEPDTRTNQSRQKFPEPQSGVEVEEDQPKSPQSPELPPILQPLTRRILTKTTSMITCSGKQMKVPLRRKTAGLTFEQTIAQRSITAEGRAKTSYYGIDIHELMDDAAKEKKLRDAEAEAAKEKQPVQSIERPMSRGSRTRKSKVHQMWTEKYRARKFTDLIGDERTHRSVLKWLKGWDSIVFPSSVRTKPKRAFEERDNEFERQHRKILLLTGPPGLGKTTLAHVCARQAGYETLEINASDDRSREVVKGRIKDALGTENVRGIKEHGQARKAGRPVCVIVDEVDGVVTGSGGGGEGGFTKALIDLVQLDQKNAAQPIGQEGQFRNKSKAGDKFRMLRPLILICNDVYAPSLRPLRNSSFAEIVHVRKAPLDKVISRLKNVFEKEHITCDNDAVRRLCENSWGLGTRKQNSIGSRGAGEGDIRGILVQGEWAAHKLKASHGFGARPRLTRKWVETHLSSSGSESSQKGLGRGGIREVVDRIFLEGAGLPNFPAGLSAEDSRLVKESKLNPTGVADLRKRAAINALREMVDMCGDYDRLLTDCFATYPTQAFQDDWNMSKANAGYEWLHFHDCLSSRVFSGQEWELNPYLSTSACGFHDLFSVVDKAATGWDEKQKQEDEGDLHPFSGPRADFAAYEAEKQHRSVLTEFQSSFSAPLLRMFSSPDAISTELVPNVGKMLAPDVKPVMVGGNNGSASVASVRKDSEKTCVRNAVRVMGALGVSFEKAKVEIEGGGAHSHGGFVYRMEPPLDNLATFHLGKVTGTAPAPVRYAVRQVLDQELNKARILQSSLARNARSSLLDTHVEDQRDDDDKENAAEVAEQAKRAKIAAAAVKRDFFGRIVNDARPNSAGKGAALARMGTGAMENDEGRVWVSFREGYSNAVKKPLTLRELLDSF